MSDDVLNAHTLERVNTPESITQLARDASGLGRSRILLSDPIAPGLALREAQTSARAMVTYLNGLECQNETKIDGIRAAPYSDSRIVLAESRGSFRVSDSAVL